MTASRRRVGVARVYDERAAPGRRVLVDRLWPRGLSKAADFDDWWPAVAPTTELRRWYGHEPKRFAEFARRYEAELGQPEPHDIVRRLTGLAQEKGGVVLLTATRDLAISHAAVLAAVVRKQ